MQERHQDNKRYFDELVYSTEKYIVPYVQKFHNISENTRVLEIGCGAGGNLLPFLKFGCEVTGFDFDSKRIAEAHEILDTKNNSKIHLFCDDVFKVKDIGLFDLIIVRDVIEHIPDKAHFFKYIKDFMKKDGLIYFAFPPWYMPFGGHQQIAKSKILSFLPFFHILPKFVYKGVLSAFKEPKDTVDELISIKECSITIEEFRAYARNNGYEVLGEEFYFINPHYEVKFKLKPRKLNSLLGKIPFVRNFVTTGCFYMLKLS